MKGFIDFSMADAVPPNRPITAPIMLPEQAQWMGGWKAENYNGQPIPTKPITGDKPPRFIVPLYPPSKWDKHNPDPHAKGRQAGKKLMEENLMKQTISKSPPGPRGDATDCGSKSGKGGGKTKKPLKVIKVIKRVQKDEDKADEGKEHDPREKGGAKSAVATQEGKGKLNQAILDKMIKEEKVQRLQGKEKSKPYNMTQQEDEEEATHSGEPNPWEADPLMSYESWNEYQEKDYEDEQWEMMVEANEENNEMEWEDCVDF